MNNEEKHIVPIELLTKYFAGEASAEEREMIEQWKDASQKNVKEFEAVKKLWSHTESVADKPAIDVESEWNKMLSVIEPAKTKVISIGRLLQIAAAILIISGLAFLGIQQSQTNRFSTAMAEASTLTLPDGSVVSLNAKSKLIYGKDFGKTNREVTLKGEGYFEVNKNPKLPFVVKAHEAQITVVGTQFNVKAYKNQPEIKVTVTEGTVQLAEQKQPTKKTVLTAGETGTYDRQVKAIKKKPLVDNNDISWKTRKMVFENTPLSNVVEVLQNTYHLDITVSETVSNCAITVVFEDQELKSVLEVLKSTLDLTYKLDGKKLYISGEGC